MNQPIQPYQQPQFQGVQAQWIQNIVPILVGIMMVVVIAGMVRNLFKGEEVKFPL